MADLPPTAATPSVFSVYSRSVNAINFLTICVSRDVRNQLEGDINAQLREACQEGEEYEVKRLLKEGADSYACDEVGILLQQII